jgi:exonuclease SbcD
MPTARPPVFRFLHAADLHLDTPSEGLHGYPAEVAHQLRESSLQAFENLVELALREEVAFVVLAGDLYDGSDRGARAELAVRRGLSRLADAGIRSFIAHGNHDPVEQGWSTVRSWPSSITVFHPGDPQVVTFTVDGVTVAVHGVSYATRETRDNLARAFHRDPAAEVQVGVLHANVDGQIGHDPYAPCSVADLVATGLDYWALGHIHRRAVLHEAKPWIVYPGNLQGRSPKPSECAAKGALIVQVDGSIVGVPRFVPLDVLRFAAVTVPIDDAEDLGQVDDLVREAAEELRAEAEGRPIILRVRLTGRGPAHALLRGDGRAQLLEALRTEGLARSPFLWVDRLDDQTRPDLDLDLLSAADDFVGNALRRIDELVTGPDLGEELSSQLPRLPADVTFPDLADPELLDRAHLLAVDLLTGGEPR